MRIKRLILSDFGKFHQEEVLLSPGLNIATGANESGKSTLKRFIRSMFYGLERERGIKARKDEYTRLKPWDYGRFQGMLEFEAEGKNYRLFRNFLTTEKKVTLTELASGRELAEPETFLRKLGLLSEAVYTNTFWVGNSCVTEELLGIELKEYLVNLAYNGGSGLNLQKSLSWLSMQKKELLRQIPEQELADCMEVIGKENGLKEQIQRILCSLEGNRERQKQLETAIGKEKEQLEQMAPERKLAEKEEQRKFVGEKLLVLSGVLAAGLIGMTFFLPVWQFKLVGWVLGVAGLVGGFCIGFPMVKKGKCAGMRKEALEKQMMELTGRIEAAYEELTRLLPALEQEKFRLEQTEEQLNHCDAARERYEELKQQKQLLLKEAEAVSLAAETLEQLSDELYEEFGTKFAAALSTYAGAFTDSAYNTLTADEELHLKAVTNHRSVELSDVSFGTGEQFYLALRFAAADVFDEEKKNPMILDDSFAAFDDQRLESAVLALKKCGRQILVLSSTGREEAAAKRMGITYEKVF